MNVLIAGRPHVGRPDRDGERARRFFHHIRWPLKHRRQLPDLPVVVQVKNHAYRLMMTPVEFIEPAKGKAVNKAAVARYKKSAKGKAAAKRYRQSEAGRKARARARAKAKSKPAAS